MVRYYDHYSNGSRGIRQRKNIVDLIPSILEPESCFKEYRKYWDRLFQKI